MIDKKQVMIDMKRNNLMKEGKRQKNKGSLYNTQTQEKRKTLKKRKTEKRETFRFQ